jgi:hypothetical protein
MAGQKKEAKIFRRNSVIFQTLHWLDWNWQLWSKDIYYPLALSKNFKILNWYIERLDQTNKQAHFQTFYDPSLLLMYAYFKY